MAKVDAAVVDEMPPEATDIESVEEVEEVEGKQKRHREKWQGGYNKIFDDADSCKHDPVFTEQGEESNLFSVYHIEEKDVEDKNNLKEYYTWARNNTEALLNVVDAVHNYHCSKLDGKRGRQKVFKPQPELVTLLTDMKGRNDTAGVAQFLMLFPDYQFVIDGTEPPATPSK